MKPKCIRSLMALMLCCLAAFVLTGTALAADIVASGSCGAQGSNLTWTLDSEGALVIRGSGAMVGGSPWRSNSASIKSVQISRGVTSIGDWAFSNCSSLTSVSIPNSVTTIGNRAFSDCTGLTSVSISDGVATIGDGAFSNCSSLTSVTIPGSVTSIDNRAFSNCTGLTSITIPEGMTNIGDSAFWGCSSLTRVDIPGSVTSIGGNAFSNCTSLASVTIPEGITSIGDWTFSDCKSLTSVTIPEGVTSIGGNAFYRCTGLTSISIPNSVTTIGGGAFENCSGLTSITIPEGVTSIGGYAFESCSGLTSVTIPGSVTSIGDRAFYDCSGLTRVDIADLDAWCRISFAGPSATPMYYAKNVYCNGDKIVAVTVPEGVKALNYTFYGFQDLIRVTLPGSLTAIGDSAFSNCGSLTRLDIPDSVTSIGSFAFSGCSALASVSIPESVSSIGSGAFYECKRLTSVTIPEGVTNIGYRTFIDCSSLASVSIPGSVTSIGDSAFWGCTSLASIAIPEGVTSIGDSAFNFCNILTNISIPSTMESIGSDAFSGYHFSNAQTSVSITDIAAWCRISFANERSNPLCSLGTLYLNGTKVETLEIPEGTQVISQYAFINARCIKRVALPKSLIGVAGNAISGCTGIEKVYYAGSENEWKDLSISNGNEPLTGAQIFYGSTLDNYYCRITAKVCTGGRVSVSATTAVEGETITVTATPYAGYQLDGIYVDGTLIEGNTFSVTGNHEVSAVFSLLPGGTGDYRLEAIAVTSSAGEKLQELRAEELLVTVAVKHTQESSGAVVMLAQYDAEGRYQGLLWLTLDEVPVGAAIKVTLPVDNRSGKISNLKAFVVGSVLSPVPMGNAVSFGSV